MKKLFFACSLLAATIIYAPSIMAQNTPPPAAAPGGPRQQLTPEQRADKQTEKMQKNLGLSDDQTTKVKQINLNFQTQIDKLRGNPNNDPQQMHTQMKALRDQRDADLKAVLTPDQYTKMQSMQQRGPQHPGTPPAPTTPPQN